MSIADLLSVLSFGLACFSAGYTFGKEKTRLFLTTKFYLLQISLAQKKP